MMVYVVCVSCRRPSAVTGSTPDWLVASNSGSSGGSRPGFKNEARQAVLQFARQLGSENARSAESALSGMQVGPGA
jgi:hypothetical protein